MIRRSPSQPPSRTGSALVIVIWTIAIATVLMSSIQLFTSRQRMIGRDAVETVRARWAARAGIEATLAVMADHTLHPVSDDAFAMVAQMEQAGVANGSMNLASWDIRHRSEDLESAFSGPMDEHSRLNLNSDHRGMLLTLLDISEWAGIIEAIEDWLDEDEEPRQLGVERDHYASLDVPFEPRNGPFQSIYELELVAGITPVDVRGEDWNLNNRLDLNEDDGIASLPEDEPDGVMSHGWSSRLTVISRGEGATASGERRLNLTETTSEDLQVRLGLLPEQADALLSFAGSGSINLAILVYTPLPGAATSPDGDGFDPLTDEQITAIINECGGSPAHLPPWGKLNINTVSGPMLLDLMPDQENLVNDILWLRGRTPQGIASLVELRDLPSASSSDLQTLCELFSTTSNVYTITSRGRSEVTGQEVEIMATVDRSMVPARIVEYREQ
jgi:hypothetical protein